MLKRGVPFKDEPSTHEDEVVSSGSDVKVRSPLSV
jgi:hypothetical protein